MPSLLPTLLSQTTIVSFKNLFGRKIAPSPSPSPSPTPSPGNSQAPRSSCSFSQRLGTSVYCQTPGGYPGQSPGNPYHQPPPTKWSTNQSRPTNYEERHPYIQPDHRHQYQPSFDHHYQPSYNEQHQSYDYYHHQPSYDYYQQQSSYDHHQQPSYQHLQRYYNQQLPYFQRYQLVDGSAGPFSSIQNASYGTSSAGTSSTEEVDTRPYYICDSICRGCSIEAAERVFGGVQVPVKISLTTKDGKTNLGSVKYRFSSKGRQDDFLNYIY